MDNSKHSDRYGRTLGVVIVDGKNVNEMLLKEGLAEVMYMPPSEFYPYDWADGNTPTSSSYSHTTSYSQTNSGSGDTGNYVGNINSGKFHNPSCKWAQKMTEGNKIQFSSRDDAINQGYEPCKVCNP